MLELGKSSLGFSRSPLSVTIDIFPPSVIDRKTSIPNPTRETSILSQIIYVSLQNQYQMRPDSYSHPSIVVIICINASIFFDVVPTTTGFNCRKLKC